MIRNRSCVKYCKSSAAEYPAPMQTPVFVPETPHRVILIYEAPPAYATHGTDRAAAIRYKTVPLCANVIITVPAPHTKSAA